jgi:hypothetical protein
MPGARLWLSRTGSTRAIDTRGYLGYRLFRIRLLVGVSSAFAMDRAAASEPPPAPAAAFSTR